MQEADKGICGKKVSPYTMKTKKTIAWITVFPHPIYGTVIGAARKCFPDIAFYAIVAKRFETIPWGEPNVQWISLDSLHIGRIAGMVYMRGLEKKLAEIQPDVIMCNLYCSFSCLQAYRFAEKKNTPLIITTEEKDSDGLVKKIMFPLWDLTCGKSILNYSFCILVWSKDSQEFMQRIVQEKKRVVYFPAGVDTSVFTKDEQKVYAPKEMVRLLMVANMIPCKDHYTLLKAVQWLKEEGFENFKLDFVGGGPLKEKLESMIRRWALEDKVQIVNPIPYSEMKVLYQNYDVLILPSRKEAVGMVVPEAMACGLPAIVSDGAGAKDYVRDGVNGFVFRAGDWKDLADKISVISKMDLVQMGKAAQKHIEENFDIHDLARKLGETLFVWENHKI